MIAKPVITNGLGRCSVYYRHPSRGCHKGSGGGGKNFPTATTSMTPGSFHRKKRKKSRTNSIRFNSTASTSIYPQLRILATALPNGLLQSTQSKLAFKTVTENRRKAQHWKLFTDSVLTHFRSSFLCIPVRIRTCRTHQSRCTCLRWGKDWGDKSFFLKGQQKLSILNNPTVLNPVILSLTL